MKILFTLMAAVLAGLEPLYFDMMGKVNRVLFWSNGLALFHTNAFHYYYQEILNIWNQYIFTV